MTTDKFYNNWKKFSIDKRKKTLDRLKDEKNDRWSGDTLEAVNDLVIRMEENIRKEENGK